MMEILFFPAFLFAGFLMLITAVPMAFLAWTVFGRGSRSMQWMAMPWRMMPGPLGMEPCSFDRDDKTEKSGNSAFDAYRAETLARLDEEAKAFEGFRARLREARDRQEFDRFMDEMTGPKE